MVRHCVATCLILTMGATPAFAQGFRESVARAVAESAAQDSGSGSGGRIPPGLLWSGVGLLGAGGLFLGLGAAEDPDNETCVSGDDFEATCVSNRTVLLSTGAVMAGVGHGSIVLTPDCTLSTVQPWVARKSEVRRAML